ncbi:MAG: molybdenum cofactor guanylyltransferase [Planctomycetes bacterium]|nr:molybdenum cofactor guanylyltransferase [Planctomycetota bacterium]MCH8963591.1 molybdenum cofactor guanylyltransferase [Planctomycetota bacterium]
MSTTDSTPLPVSVVAGILAGGKSTRMGRPKALIELPTGGSMIEHTVQVARQITDEVVVLGREIRLPASLEQLTILDDEKSDGGPLAGLCSLLKCADPGWGLLLACDMPYIESAVIRRLLAQADPDTDAVVFERSERRESYHACCGLYHSRIARAPVSDPAQLAPAPEVLFDGDASLNSLLKRIRVKALKPTPEESRQLRNINTPEDLAKMGPN